LERIAKVGDVVHYGDFTLIVKEIDGARITKILLVKHEQQAEEKEG
jgi:CBS domain containing-hemolysin-like protein